MTFAEYVVANSDKSLTDEQRAVLLKYEQRRLGDKNIKLSIIPGGKAEGWLKEWWDKYQESREVLFDEIEPKRIPGECSGCRVKGELEACYQCGKGVCEECVGVCHICGEAFCVEGCFEDHGCEEY